MDDIERKALAVFLAEIADACTHLARALDASAGDGKDGSWGPAHAKLPWNERVLRQSLIIQEILDAGGKVAKTTWYEIAAKYGYSGRGISGFFRAGTGLLQMDNNGFVTVTKRGKLRLLQNTARVEETRAAQNA